MAVVMVVVGRRGTVAVEIELVVVGMFGFEQADGEREGDAEQEGGRQYDAVMAVELDLGQDVRQRDAQEHAGREPERAADRHLLAGSQFPRAEIEQQRTGRTDQREQQVHDVLRRELHCPAAITEVIESESSGLWNKTARNVPIPSNPHVDP